MRLPKISRDIILKDYDFKKTLKENIKRLEKEGININYFAAYHLIKDKLKRFREYKNKKAEELFLKYKDSAKKLSIKRLKEIIKDKENIEFNKNLLDKTRKKYLTN